MHTVRFSHEFDDGPSGPARSYYDIERNGRKLITVCLGPRRQIDPLLTAQLIAHAMDETYQAGRTAMAVEFKTLLGIK